MYRKAQLFEDRLHKIGSDSLLLDRAGEQAKIIGDPNKEYYDAFMQTQESRHKLNNLLVEVIHVRKKSADAAERGQLFRLQKKIEATLRAGKKMTPRHKHTLSQVFMSVAEQTLNHDVYQAIIQRTHELYHSPQNVDVTKKWDEATTNNESPAGAGR